MSSSFSYLQHPREAFDLLSPLHLGPDPLPNFAPVNVGAPLPRRALKPVPLPDVDAVAMPGDHLFESVESLPLPQDPEPEQGGSELERRRKEVDEDEDERNAFAQHHRYEHESTHTASKVALAKAPFYSELDVQADAYGRRNRPRLDTRPQRLTYVDDSLNYNHFNLPTYHSSSSASANYLSSAGSSRRPQGRLSNTGPGLKRLPTWKATSGSGSAGGAEGSTKTQTQNEVYESVSCMPGCEGYSFEELRVVCYAQSYQSTGAPPRPPRPEEGYLFPPEFEPFVCLTSASSGVGRDVVMSDQNLVSAFTFNMPASTQH